MPPWPYRGTLWYNEAALTTILRGPNTMTFKAIIHDAEEGGYWAEVPALPGCVTQGETLQELHDNLREAILGCLAVLNDRNGSPDRVRDVVEISV